MARPVSSSEARAAGRIGTLLGGKFRIARVLGVGGMAVVYLAVHRNGHRVAVKLLHPELSVHDDIRARFVREGYVANAVGHPGAVRVLDDDVAADGSAFLVMELLDGESLGERLRRLGPRPIREVLALGHQLLDVLAAAHDKGVVHRDIKPENLFLTTARALKVLDFGIARIRDDPGILATQTGTRLGTPAFMPPEQALGRREQVDGRTDLWACGATLFTLLSGRLVHEAETAEEVIVRAATQPSRSLADAVADVPAPIAAVIDRALRYARDDRWPTARAMAEALEQAHTAAYGEPLSPTAIDPAPTPRLGDDKPTSFARPDEPTVTLATLDPANTAPFQLVAGDQATQDRSTAPPTRADETRREPPSPSLRPLRTARLLGLAAFATLALIATWRFRSTPPASPVSPAAVVSPHCLDHRTCTANAGKPSLCRKDDGLCIPLESDDCHILASPGDVENESTIWFGAMFPHHVTDPTEYGPRSANAIELARRDFADTSSGLPPTHPGGPRRPIALVLCDDATHPTRAAEHLVNDLRVPAILGFARSKEVLDLASELFLPKGVLALAANTASALRDIPHPPGEPRLVWRVTVTGDSKAPIQRDLLAEVVEPELRRTPGLLAPGAPIRVALARLGNPSGQSVADGLVAALRFNGRSVTDNGDNVRMFAVPDAIEADDPAVLARIAAEIAAYQPHVVLAAAAKGTLIPAVEQAWPAAARHRPRYLWDTAIVHAGVLDFAAGHPEARRRMLFVDSADDNAALAKYLARYNEVFSPPQQAQSVTCAPYDAFYLLAYATAALGDAPITGPSLARAIPRLMPPGERVDVGPGGIYAVLYALGSGRNVDLDGTQTSLDFDLQTGDATADYAVKCLSPGSAGHPPQQVLSGLTFRARSRKLEGTLSCP